MKRRSVIIRSFWAACLLIGGLNHARILLHHGLAWDYGGVNPISAAYWTSLTVLDPLVAGLLFLRPRVGIAATIALIVTNVTHNLAMTAYASAAGEFVDRAFHPIILSQVGFMLFVVATTRMAWQGVARR